MSRALRKTSLKGKCKFKTEYQPRISVTEEWPKAPTTRYFKEIYVCDCNANVIKSKYSRTVPYDQVCPSTPPFVPALVIELMNELERRVPPLTNLTMGYSTSFDKAETLLDNWITHSKYQNDIPSVLYDEDTTSLVQVLQLFLDRLELPLFCATTSFIEEIMKYCFLVTDTFQESHLHFTAAIDKCLIGMGREQIATTAYIIQKIQLWIRKNIEYVLQRNIRLTKDQVYTESVAFLHQLIGPYLVGLPTSFLRSDIAADQGAVDTRVLRCEYIFSRMISDANSNYWHEKTIEAYNMPDDIDEDQSTVSLMDTVRKSSLHWV